MFPTGLKIAGRAAAVNQQFIRSITHGATKPRNHCSFGEQCAHGILIATGVLATPAYIAYNLKYYTGREERN